MQTSLFEIVNFAVGFVGIVLSLFAIWLSWQFYKEARETGDKTVEAVGRIEVTVAGVNNNIMEIVQRAVSYWTQTEGGAELAASSMSSMIEEMQKQLSALNAGAKPDDIQALLEKVQSIEVIAEEARSRASRNIFPGLSAGRPRQEPGVLTTQRILEESEGFERGTLTLCLTRPMPIATGTGKFSCALERPSLKVSLISVPAPVARHPNLKSGFGVLNDFNVHLNAIYPSRVLEVGEYVVEYVATEHGADDHLGPSTSG